MFRVMQRIRATLWPTNEGLVVCVLFTRNMFQVEWDDLTSTLPTIFYSLHTSLIERIPVAIPVMNDIERQAALGKIRAPKPEFIQRDDRYRIVLSNQPLIAMVPFNLAGEGPAVQSVEESACIPSASAVE